MKKIKGLLLFGILTLLGIGSSFAGISIGTSIDYYSENGGLTSYNFAQQALSQSMYGGFIYYNGNLFNNVVNYSPFYTKGGAPVSFNLSDYSLVSGLPHDYNLGSNNSISSIYFDSDLNKLALWLYYDYRGTQVSRFFPLSNGFSSLSTSNLIVGDGYYVRVFGDSSCLNTGTILSGSCSPNYVQVFTNSQYTYSSDGTYIDSQYNDVNYVKGAIAPGVYKGYSFGFVSGSGWQNGVIDTTNGDFFDFRYIDFQGNEIVSYDGIYLIRLDSSYSVDSSNYNVLALGITGNVNDFSLTYSIYNCPSNSSSISNCSFAFGGLTNYTGLNTSSLNTNTDFGKLLYLLTSSNSSRKISTSYNGNTINFFGGYYINGQYDVKYTYNYNLSLSTVSDLDIIGSIPDGGGGNQSSGSIAINTGLLNLCLNDLQFGELNSYLCNQLLSNLGNPVQIPGTSGQYISVSIDENGNLRYWITTQDDLAEQMSGFIWVENEDGSWSTVCPSGDCLGTVLTQPINHGNTGFVFSTGDVLDMMSNLTGWVGRCPFPYTDFRLGKNLKLLQLLQDYGFNYDPFIIINCSVAGFQYGRHTIDNTLFGDTFEYPLLYGDTPKHRTLFVFLDFVVILGLFGLFAFIKKIF